MANLKKTILKWVLVSIYLQFMFLLISRPFLLSMGNNRANFFSEMGKHNIAIQHYKRVLWLDPKNLPALIWCGFAYEDLNNLKTAKQYYLRAIQAYADRNEGYYFMANLLMRERNYEQAKSHYQKAARYPGEYTKEIRQAIKILNLNK